MSEEKIVGRRSFLKGRLDALVLKKSPLRAYESFLKLNYASDPAPSPLKVDTISRLLKIPAKSIKSWFQRHRSSDYKAKKLCSVCRKFFAQDHPLTTNLCECQKVAAGDFSGEPGKESEIPSSSAKEESVIGRQLEPSSSMTPNLPKSFSSENSVFEAVAKEVEVATEDSKVLEQSNGGSTFAENADIDIKSKYGDSSQLDPIQGSQDQSWNAHPHVTSLQTTGPRNTYLATVPGYPLVRSILNSLVQRHRPVPVFENPFAFRPLYHTPDPVLAFPDPSYSSSAAQPVRTSTPLPGFRATWQPLSVGNFWHPAEEGLAFDSDLLCESSSGQVMWCPYLD